MYKLRLSKSVTHYVNDFDRTVYSTILASITYKRPVYDA